MHIGLKAILDTTTVGAQGIQNKVLLLSLENHQCSFLLSNCPQFGLELASRVYLD